MWRDDAYLLDILLNSRRVIKYTTGVTKDALQENEVLQSAVIHWLLIIGEAARSISDEKKTGPRTNSLAGNDWVSKSYCP